MRVCTWLFTAVIHNTAQNSSNNFRSYSPENCQCTDVVNWREAGKLESRTDVSTQHLKPNEKLQHCCNRQVIIITLPSAVPNIICWSGGQMRHVTALCWMNLLHIVFLSFLKTTSHWFAFSFTVHASSHMRQTTCYSTNKSVQLLSFEVSSLNY